MKKNMKSIFFVATILILIFSISAINATEVSNDTTVQDTVSATDSVQSIETTTTADEKIVEKSTTKNMEETTNIENQVTRTTINNDNFDEFFTSTGFTSNVSDGDNLTFSSDITRSGNTYLLDKAVNIIGNDYTICLNTTSGSYFGNQTGSSFIFDQGAAGSNVTNINFYNTQVIVRNTSNIVFDDIDVTVENRSIGSGIGVFSIRADSSYITVDNSRFSTTNNGGSSTLVLASASYCTIDHNNITGVGNVGNLLYLTTYNIEGAELTDIELNSYNNITYNNITGPSTASFVRYGIALTGHDNNILYNNVSMAGQGITTQWAYTDPETPEIGDNSERYKGNTYTGNNLTGGASFKATNNSTITSNTLNSVTLVENCTFVGNNATIVSVTGKNNYLCNNTIGTLTVQSAATNTSVCECNDIINIIDNNSNIVDVSCDDCEYCSDEVDSVILSQKTLKADGENVFIYNVTEENFNQYIGSLDTTIYPNTSYITTAQSTYIYNINYIPENTTKISISTNVKNVRTSTLRINFNNLTLTNVNLEYSGGALRFEMGNVTLNYNDLYTDSQMVFINPKSYTTQGALLENITINSNKNLEEGDETYYVSPIAVRNSYGEKTGITINNTTINMQSYTSIIHWGTNNIPYTIPIRYVDVQSAISNLTVSNSVINFNETDVLEDNEYNTMWGAYLRSNTTFVNNTINIKGSQCVYALVARGSNNIISNNIINSESTGYYACGIDVESQNIANNTLENNYINVTAGYGENANHNPHVAYGALILDYSYGGGKYTPNIYSIQNVSYVNNTIIGNAGQAYGVEIYGGNNLNISDNNINLTARVPMAIGAIGENVTISGNNIIATGSNNGGESTVDYLTSRTVGVYTRYTTVGLNITNNNINTTTGRAIYIDHSNNTNIQDNNINVENYTYTVELYGDENIVTNNYLMTEELKGDQSVLDTGESNTIEDNLPVELKYTLKVDTTEFTIGQNATIKASIYLGDDVASDVNKGKVVFKVNGKTLKDSNNKVIYAKVTNGTAIIEGYEVPESWCKDGITIEAVYSGSTQCEALRSGKQNMTISYDTTPSITTSDITATVGSTVTLKAQVTGSSDIIAKSKVVFKINGKSVKDATGKVIYAQVENGEVSFDYVLPSTLKAKTYNIVAVLIMPNYERLEDSKTLTLTTA